MQALRAAWAAWNPQRAAAKELERRVVAGEITLQDTIIARQLGPACEPVPGTLHPDEAESQGWYGHPKPFLWLMPRCVDLRKCQMQRRVRL